MKFKVSFARVVNEGQLVEGIIEAESKEAALDKFSTGDFERFLILKRELRQVTPVGDPELEQVA